MKDTLKLTNKLAKERTQLANERTMLAYLRTAFSLFLFAIAVLKLFEDWPWALPVGIFSLVMGVLFIIIGIAYYKIRNKRIREY